MTQLAVKTAPVAARVDQARYRALLGETLPKVIESAAEHKRAMAVVNELLEKTDRTAEETTLAKMMATLIQQYEETAFSREKSTPLEILEFVMEQNNLKAIDLADLMGSRAAISRVLSGKREISKAQAKALGERFRVSPAVFI